MFNNVTVDPSKNRLSDPAYSYDAAGNMTNDGQNTLVYDGENRRASSTTNGTTSAYTYDGKGLRVQKSSGRLYWYGLGGDLLDESDASGNITDEYVFFNGKRMARRNVSSGNIFYLKGPGKEPSHFRCRE